MDDVDYQKRMAQDEEGEAINSFLDAMNNFKKAQNQNDVKHGRQLLHEVEARERELIAIRLEKEESDDSHQLANAIREGDPLDFYWKVHFPEVFRRDNNGFDVVIANPPYVRVQSLKKHFKKQLANYESRFISIRSGAKDLYLPFVEQALSLAGKEGRIAYIMPNFSRSATARPLRELYQKRKAIDLWVDFCDNQVFPSSTNYVALLFASNRGSHIRKRTFPCTMVKAYHQDYSHPYDIIDNGEYGDVLYDSFWRTMSNPEKKFVRAMEKNTIVLGDVVDIGVGVQTSADDVFLLHFVAEKDDNVIKVYSDELKKNVIVEKSILRPIAKGSKHLRQYFAKREMYILWPYNEKRCLLSDERLPSEFPLAWRYLKKCRATLRGREKGRFNDDTWWRFGRAQGFELCQSPKILIPSLMKGATAVYDFDESVAFTASGKGGGGAYGITITREDVLPRWVLAVLNSDVVWKWLQI